MNDNKDIFALLLSNHLEIFLTLLIFFLFLTASIFFLFSYINFEKKRRKNISILVPLVFDDKNQRIRLIDSKFKDSAEQIFKNKSDIFNGKWVNISEFAKNIKTKDRVQFLEILKNWSNQEIEFSLLEKERKEESTKKYKFIFSKNDEDKTIIIQKNNYAKFEYRFWTKMYKKLKIKKTYETKTKKRYSLFFSFSLIRWFIKEDVYKNIVEKIIETNFLLSIKIKQIVYDDGNLSFMFTSNSKKEINILKSNLVKKFNKFKNNFFFNYESIVIIDNKANTKTTLNNNKIKKIINFSLWKSKESKTIFELEHPYFLEDAEELEKYNLALENLKNWIKKDKLNKINLEIRNLKRKIGQIQLEDIPLETRKYLSYREKYKIAEKILLEDLDKKVSDNSNFIFTYTDLFLNNYSSFDKNTSNLIIKIKSFLTFVKRAKEKLITEENKEFDRWGLYIEKMNNSLFSLLTELKPKFLVISSEILSKIDDNFNVLTLESLFKIAQEKEIMIIYENKKTIIKDEQIIDKIGYKYYYYI